MRKNFLFLFLFVTTACLFAFIQPLQAANVVKGPYLIYPDNNAQMTVLWQLDATVSCTLEWGTDTTYSTGSVQTAEYGSDNQHRYTIGSLSPATKYYYRVNADSVFYTGSFLSAPAAATANVKFLAYGDTRTYPDDHDTVCAQMVTTFTNDPAYQTFTVHVGDWVNDGDLENDWRDEFFDRAQPNALNMMANLPILGCMGNHEYSGVLFQKYFPYPFESGGRYWSYDYGPVHVVILDQYIAYTPGSTQYNWLVNDLSSTTKTWKFIVLHEPGWSAGGHSNEADVQDYIQPLCLEHGVKVVFGGHNHYYARCEVDGVHHVTCGGGGAPLYAPSSSADFLVAYAQTYHHCEIDLQGDTMSFVTRDWNGGVIDTFTTTPEFPPQLPWMDGFESGDYSTGRWITSGKVRVVNGGYIGSRASRTTGAAVLEKSISTKGFTNIHVKYARMTTGLDAGEFLVAEWYDGSSWHQLEQTQDTSWQLVDYACPAGADDNASFKVRFTASQADNKEYTYLDAVEIFAGTSGPDTTPPTPDPMTFAAAPYATGSSSIAMTATTASDTSGVEYFFQCTAGGGHDSGWQDSASYEDTGLSPETQYTYAVKARDKSSNQNETAYSGTASAITDPAGGLEMYVNDIAMTTKKTGPKYTGKALVHIKDTTGGNVSGATVYGTWSGSVSGTESGVTAADGTIQFASAKVSGGGTFTFTVTDVVKSGVPYNAALNNETSDSITI